MLRSACEGKTWRLGAPRTTIKRELVVVDRVIDKRVRARSRPASPRLASLSIESLAPSPACLRVLLSHHHPLSTAFGKHKSVERKLSVGLISISVCKPLCAFPEVLFREERLFM